MASWKVHAQAYTSRTLGNERILSKRRSNGLWPVYKRRLKAKAILWSALAIIVPGGSVVALVAWFIRKR